MGRPLQLDKIVAVLRNHVIRGSSNFKISEMEGLDFSAFRNQITIRFKTIFGKTSICYVNKETIFTENIVYKEISEITSMKSNPAMAFVNVFIRK